MVKFYNWVGLSLLFILSCGNPINITGPKYSDVIVTEARFDDQLIVKGSRFKDIRAVALRDPNTGQIIKRFKVMRYDDHTIIGEQTDYNKIPIPNILDMLIDSAQGQSVIPVQFTISPNSVYTGAIQNGAITPTKFLGITSPDPADQSVLTWSSASKQFLFSPSGGGGGGGGDVTGIYYGTGIVGDGNTATGTVTINVNIGTTGSPNPPEKTIPFFNDQNQIVLDSTANPNTQLLFISGSEKISLSNEAGLFKIINETIALPAPERDLLTIDAINERVTVQNDLYVGSQTVCLADGNGCPTGIQPITGVAPIIVTGPQISADTGTGPGQLVILGDGTSTPTGPGFLPGVDGSHLTNIVTKINALDGITVSNGGIGIVDIGLAPAGSTGSAQPWSPALTDISTLTYPPVDGGVIVGNGTNYDLESGDIFRAHVGLAIGVDVQAFNQNLEQISNATPTAPGQFLLSSNPGQWSLANNPNCGPSGFLMAGNGTTFNCSDTTFIFKLKEIQFFDTVGGGGSYVGFAAPTSVLTNTIWELPPQDGTLGQVLTTDGAKRLSWGTGNGDVRGPAASVDRDVAIFQGTTGKVITDSNILIDNLVSRSATPVVSGNLPSYAGPTGNLIQDSTIISANVVTSTGGSPSQNLPMFTGTGKAIQDSFIPAADVMTMLTPSALIGNVITSAGGKSAQVSNIVLTDFPTMAANATGTYQPILSVANGSKALVNASYSIPLGVCPSGEILKSNGTNFICGIDSDTAPPVSSVFGRIGAVVAVAGDYGADQVISTPTGFMAANNVQAAINELDTEKLALAGGTMTGQLITSSQNAILIGKAAGPISGELKFEEATGNQYVGFKAPNTVASNIIWTLPDLIGTNGQVLTTVGGGVLQWTSVGTAGVGDVVGPSSSTSTNLASFNGTTGKLIQDSGISSTNVVTMIAAPLIGNVLMSGGGKSAQDSTILANDLVTNSLNFSAANRIVLSAGSLKAVTQSSYTIPPTIGTATYILKSDGTNATWQPDLDTVYSVFGRTGAVVAVAGDYNAAQVNSTPTGFLSANNVQNALNELDTEKIPAAGGTMTGALFTTTQYAIGIGAPGPNTGEVRFFEASNGPNYAGFKSPAVLAANYILTLPLDGGTNGQILSTTGAGVLSWTTPGGGGAGGVGDVVGPASAISTNLASFNGATGKLIQDSLIPSNNVMTMTGPALSAGNILVSQGLNKVAIDTSIKVGLGNDVTNLGTLNTRTIANWVDGPASASSTNLAAFNGASGKAIQDSGLLTANIPTMGLNATNPNQMILSGGVSKQLVAATYTVPASSGATGQILTITSPNVATWAFPVGIGDVVGASSSTLNALVRYNSTSGKSIYTSPATLDDFGGLTGITSINGKTAGDFVTMATPATNTGQVFLSAGAKAAVAAPYTFPVTQGLVGQVLKLNSATDATWQTIGGGDVSGPGPTTALNEVAVWVDNTGTKIKGVPLIYLNIVTNIASSTVPNHVAIFDSATGKSIADSGKLITDLVTGPAGTTAGNLASYTDAVGNKIQNSGIATANVVTMIATPAAANYVYLSNGADKTAKTSSYTLPPTVCTLGQVLKSDGTNYTCSPVGSGDVIGPATSVAGRPATYLDASGKTLANTVPYTIPTLTGIPGQVLTTDGVGGTSWNTITPGTGDVVGPGGSADNQAVLFSGTTGKIIKTAPYTLPTANGTSGQALTTNGAGVASWSNVGNVAGAASSIAGNIPSFSDASGKALQDSNIPSANIVQMPNAATFVGQLLMSNGPGKQAQPSPYKFPTDTLGTNGQVLTSNGVDVIWASAAGNVVGPATSALNELAVFADGTGKLIKAVPLVYLNIVTNTATPTVPNHVAVFDSATGKSIIDSGKLITNLVTGPAGALVGNLASYSVADGKTIQDSLIPTANVVQNNGAATANAIARFDLATGKLIKNSPVVIDDSGNLSGVGTINGNSAANIVTMNSTPTAANYVYLSNGNDKTAKTTTYTFPPGPCLAGQILKTDASFNFQCVADTSGVASFNSRIGAVMPAGNDYTASMVVSTASGAISATSTQGAINELEAEKLALAGGTMTGQLKTSTQDAILIGKAAGPISGELKFEEATGNQYVGFKSPDTLAGNVIWTLPIADGTSGAVLSTNGAAQLYWTSPSAAGFGDVTGPASSSDNAIARFDLATGKLIQNSVVTISDGGDLSGVASFTSSGNFSVSGAGSFTGGLSAQSYTNTSDKSLKKDIELFTGASSIIDKLMPVTFRWKTGDEKKVIGLIAQDMEKVIPDVVSKSNQKGNVVRSYDLGQVLILTLEALKETREELKETKNELKVFQDKVKDLEKRIR